MKPFSRIDFARLNYILIPKTKAKRDRFRKSRFGRAVMPLAAVYLRLSREGRAVFAIAALTTVFVLEVRRTDAYLLWGALVALILSSLAFGRSARLNGVTVVASSPRRVTVGDEITFTLAVQNDSSRPIESLRIEGPFLPWDGTWTLRGAALATLTRGSSARLEMRARFRERGEHQLDPFHAATLLPLGLAMGPSLDAQGPRFLVVPRVARVASLTLPRTRSQSQGGTLLSSKKGDSRDLLGVRPYRPGDPVRDLHAKSWARTGQPVVREYQEEPLARTCLFVDTDRGDAPQATLEAAIEVAAGLIFHLARGEAIVDTLVLGDAVHTLGNAHPSSSSFTAIDHLACITHGSSFDADRAISRLRPHRQQLASLVFVALRFEDERARFVEQLRMTGLAVRVIVVSDEAASVDGIVFVTPRAIAAGEPLAL